MATTAKVTGKRKSEEWIEEKASKKQKVEKKAPIVDVIDFTIQEAPKEILEFLHSKTGYPIASDLGETEWKLQFSRLNVDNNEDDTKTEKSENENNKMEELECLNLLFDEKLSDWKRFINKNPLNNFLCVIKDNFGIWRAACFFIVYKLQIKPNITRYLLKIPLTGVDLHFRKQGLGTLCIQYMISIAATFLDQDFHPIVLAMENKNVKQFWRKNGFVEMKDSKLEYSKIFEKELMMKKGFLIDTEDELVMMNYEGKKDKNLLIESELFKSFKKPKYVNFDKRYAHKDEIEEIEKHRKENPELYEEYEKKIKEINEKQDDEDEEEDDDDEDYEGYESEDESESLIE